MPGFSATPDNYPDPWGPGGKFIEWGLQPVDGCVPDCPFCNGTDDAPCLCGEGCEGRVV